MYLFAQLSKIDLARHEVWGVATAEIVDKEGEIFDYESSKPHFQSWSDEIAKATDGRSLGNVREMHAPSAVGKLVALEFDDQLKQIRVGAKIVDAAAWQKCTLGVYTGFSIGGSYVKTWRDGEFTRFTASPVEISVVDNPCVPGAHFTAIKTDGTTELRKFRTPSTSSDHARSSDDPMTRSPDGPISLTNLPTSPITKSTQSTTQTTSSDPSDPSNQRSSAVRLSASTQLSPGAHMTEPENSISSLHKDLADLRAEIAATNQELEKSLANLIALMEKIVSPNAPNTKLARTAVPGITVRKEDDSTSPEKPETPPSVHELLKLALQNPQRAANYLR